MTQNSYSFGKASLRRLAECHPQLQHVMRRVIQHRDCAIVCGFRGKEAQNTAFAEGKSKLQFPESKHNQTPALAVDVVPWPEKWASEAAFTELAEIIRREAKSIDVRLRWGGDWDSDGDRTDQQFHDLPHWELALGELALGKSTT